MGRIRIGQDGFPVGWTGPRTYEALLEFECDYTLAENARDAPFEGEDEFSESVPASGIEPTFDD